MIPRQLLIYFTTGLFRILMPAWLIFSLYSCSVTQPIAINTLEPAPVNLSHNIKRIGIFSQQFNTQQLEESTGLEAWISHSDQQLSEAGKLAAMNGLFEALSKDTRFDTIQVLDASLNTLAPIGQEGSQIPWEEMEAICSSNNIDALFSLAYYETDTRVSLKKTKVNQKDLLRENVKVNGHEITLETLIENGWRIYDPFNKLILDEIILNDHLVNMAEGEDPIDAFQAIESRKDSVMILSGRNGSTFGLRLKPFQHTIYREYYTKGTENLVEAHQMTLTNDWKSARVLWELDTSHSDDKIKGRACHNLAVFNEYHGDLESALEWAIKSKTISDSKMAQSYLEALQQRLITNQIVEEQLLQQTSKLSKNESAPRLDFRQ